MNRRACGQCAMMSIRRMVSSRSVNTSDRQIHAFVINAPQLAELRGRFKNYRPAAWGRRPLSGCPFGDVRPDLLVFHPSTVAVLAAMQAR